MTKETLTRFEVSTKNPELFSIHSVAHSPRSLSPHDLTSAVENLKLDFHGEEPGPVSSAFVQFLFADFFVQAHSSGLYNRQLALWEAITRIGSGTINPLRTGWFLMSKEHPVEEVVLLDSLGRPLVLAWLVQDGGEINSVMSMLIKKVNKMKLQESPLCGVFLALPEPVDETFLEKTRKFLGADDPVARYDARLPEPALIPLNLLDYRSQHQGDQANQKDQKDQTALCSMRLIHPTLRKASGSRSKPNH